MTTQTERGQSIVELAISLTVILFLLAGAVEFGIAFFQFIQLRDAAQEGALYGSICPVESKIIDRVRNASNSPVDLSVTTGPEAVGVTVTWYNGTSVNPADQISSAAIEAGDGVKVEVTYNHRIFMPFISAFIGSNTIPLRASVTDTILDTNTSKSICQ